MNNDQLIAAFKTFIAARAAREGIDISDLSLDWATLDATWGDKCGYVVSGLTSELNERVAKCFEKFCSKHAGSGRYDSQRSIGFIEHLLYARRAKPTHARCGPCGYWILTRSRCLRATRRPSQCPTIC